MIQFNDTLQTWANKFNISNDAQQGLNELLMAPTNVNFSKSKIGSETDNSASIRLAAPHHGCILWRNNVGAFLTDRGVPVRTGLANTSKRVNSKIKSSDLIGIASLQIKNAFFGVFMSIEVKKAGWTYKGTDLERAQLAYILLVKKYGGIAGFATSVDDFVNILQRYYRS